MGKEKMENDTTNEVKEEQKNEEEKIKEDLPAEKETENEKVVETEPIIPEIKGDEEKETEQAKETKQLKQKKPSQKIFMILGIILIIAILGAIAFKVIIKPLIKEDQKIYTNFNVSSIKTESGNTRDISTDSTFIIETDKAVNTESVRRKVYIEPSIDYDVKAISKTKYKLIPTNGLEDNEVYTIEDIKDEKATYKWAFETKRKLSVVSINGSTDYNHTYVAKDNAFTIEFSMEGVENLEKYVTISPKISGKWKKYNSSWVFEHTEKLKEGQIYTLTISKDLKVGNYSLNKTIKSEIECYSPYNSQDDEITFESQTPTIDNVNTFSPDENPKVTIELRDGDINSRAEMEFDTVIYKFNGVKDFKEAIDSPKTIDTTKLTKFATTKAKSKDAVATLDQTLPKGYYVMSLKYKNKVINQLIQVVNIQAFVLNTEKDTLVWAMKNGFPASDIKVEFNDKSYKTNKNGIATLKNISTDTNEKTYLTVNSDSENPTIILAKNYKQENYPNAYIYTDRPIYKPTDTIEIWGYVPLKEFAYKVENNFAIKFGNTSKKVKINKNGTFTTKIKIKNYGSGDSDITLYYKDSYITSRDIEIYNYIKPTYTYSIENLDKKYYYAGETIKFDVKVEHITGLTAKNKVVNAYLESKKYTAKTNSKGYAHFEIKTKYDKENFGHNFIYVKTGDTSDDTDVIQASDFVYIYNYNVGVKTNIKNQKLSIESYKIDFAKLNKDKDYKEEDGEKYNTNATVKIYKNTSTRYIESTEYSDYEKKMVNVYNWNYDRKLVETKSVNISKGKGELDVSKYKTISTEEKQVSYSVEVEVRDTNGRLSTTNDYINYFNENDDDGGGFKYYSLNITNDKKYDINDNVSFQINSPYGPVTENDGKILLVFYKEGIIDTQIISTDEFSFKFKKEYFPGVYVTAAYLSGGKVYETGFSPWEGYSKGVYLDYDETKKKANIEIKPDKENYKPGDKVTLKIKTKDEKEKPLVTDLNISVVDEAIFEIKQDDTSIVETIYDNRYFQAYQMSTNRFYSKFDGGGGGDVSAPGPRYNFKDTAYFTSTTTNKNGEATVSFKLPDNITKYRVTTHAANKDEYLGVNTKTITATQDFFVESPIPVNVKYTDDLVINAISHGKNIKDTISYTFKLDDKELKATGKIDEYVSVNFNRQTIGNHKLTITAKTKDKTDTVVYNVKIITNHQEVKTKTTKDISSELNIKPTKNPIRLEIYDKKLETYLKYVDQLEKIYSSRIDTKIGIHEAYKYNKKFNKEEADDTFMDLSSYIDSELVLSNPTSKKTDALLSAIVSKYALGYVGDLNFNQIITKQKSSSKEIYSAYLGLASQNRAILKDLDYLRKTDTKRDDLETIILANSYAFLGDYTTAKEIYKEQKVTIKDNKIYIKDKEVANDDTKALIAILTSMIDKNTSTKIIDHLINKKSTSMYLNFAIISYLDNNTESIEKNKKVTITYGKNKKEVTISGFKVETLDINQDELSTISFSNYSKDLKVSYYYVTSIDELNEKSIKKDVTVSLKKNLKKNETTTLKVKYDNKSKDDGYEIKIALPHGLSIDEESIKLPDYVYLDKTNREYVSMYVSGKKSISLNIPITAINEGKYIFEPVVIYNNGTHHISNKININISK